MTFRLKEQNILPSKAALAALPDGKLLINTINAHSYNTARRDALFAEALTHGDVLIPDGISIVKACRWVRAKSRPVERIAGWDLFQFEMQRLNEKMRLENAAAPSVDEAAATGRRAKVMFVGSSDNVLALIRERVRAEYLFLDCVTLSPPYKKEFSEEENKEIIDAINRENPDLLWIGMTAPKQEKWTYAHWDELNVRCHVGTIGAVFDFFAGTMHRAPLRWQRLGLEWLYRLLKEPRRMWRRYLVGNVLFLWNILVHEH